MGGLQQQFYELRGEVNKVTQTMNRLKKDKRFDELATYRANYQGVMNVKGQVRALEIPRELEKKRDAVMRRDDISVVVKSDLIRELELQRDQRLAFVPELRKKAMFLCSKEDCNSSIIFSSFNCFSLKKSLCSG